MQNTLCGGWQPSADFCAQFCFSFASKRPQALFGATVCHCAMLLGCRIPKINANMLFFPLLSCFSMQQEIPEEEATRAALVQAVSEKRRRSIGGGMLRVWNWRLYIAWNFRLYIECHWGCNARPKFQKSFQGFLEAFYFYGSWLFRKLRIESSRLLYTTGIHLVVVRIDFFRDVYASLLQFQVQFELAWLHRCNSRAKI